MKIILKNHRTINQQPNKNSPNYQRLDGDYYILNGDGRFVKNDKDFAVFSNSFLKGLLINDDIAYIGMNWIDRVENKYKPLAIAMVDTKMGRKKDFVSIPSFNIFGQRNVADKTR